MRIRRTQFNAAPDDRRLSGRLPITELVSYKIPGHGKVSQHTGSGKTLNMSSTGVLFTTEGFLVKGLRIELAVNWPVTLEGVPLKLVLQGRVVWAENGQAAMSIDQYEFKTRRSEPGLDVGLRKVS